jgi:hypothetical protein
MLHLIVDSEYYERFYDENLMDRIRAELGANMENLCCKLVAGCRNRTYPQPASSPSFNARAVAERLYAGGEGKWGTDEGAFIDILISHTAAELKSIMDHYDSSYNNSLERTIQSEFSGEIERALVGLLYPPEDFYCRLLKDATSGIGTDESTVSRILGAHDKVAVHKIAERYFQKYDEKLVDMLSGELYYDYRVACMTYVQTSDITDGMEDRLAAMEIANTEPAPKPPSKVPEK